MSSTVLPSTTRAADWGILIGVAPALAFFLVGLSPVVNLDIWTHLKMGQIILEHRVLPRTDLFTCTAFGRPSPPLAWLFQILVYVLHAVGGAELLSVAKALIFAVSMERLHQFLRGSGGSGAAAWIACLAGSMAMRPRVLIRPHLVSILMMVLLIRFMSRRSPGRWWWLLPVLALWSNLHAGATLGWMVLGIFLLEHVCSRFAEPDPRRRLLFAGSLFLMGGLCLLANPAGVETLLYGWRHSVGIAGSKVAEFRRPTLTGNPEILPLLVLLCCSIPLAWRRIRLHQGLLLLLFGGLALRHQRAVPYLAIAVSPIIVQGLDALRARWHRAGLDGLLKAGILLLALLQAAFILGSDRQGFGIGVWRPGIPDSVVRTMDRWGIQGPVLNTNHVGSYLIWSSHPRRPVFSDGRQILHQELHESIYELTRSPSLEAYFDGWEALAAKYGCDYAVVNHPEPGQTGIHRFLHRRWSLLHWDDCALLYVRPGSSWSRLTEQEAIRGYHPTLPSPVRDPRASIPLLRKVLERDPQQTLTRLLLARALLDAGRIDEAREHLSRLVAQRPRWAPVRALRRSL